MCTETGSDAPFSQRLVNSDDVELIGGSEMYRAASRSSYMGIKTAGEIHLTMGPVKSGKTTELIRVLTRHYIARRSAVLITHRSIKKELRFNVISANELPSIESLNDYQLIGVDEGHKFAGLAKWADTLANSGKLVVISALDGDRNQEPYQEIVDLFPLCEQVMKFESVCKFTGQPAPFTAKKGHKFYPVSRLELIKNRRKENSPSKCF